MYIEMKSAIRTSRITPPIVTPIINGPVEKNGVC